MLKNIAIPMRAQPFHFGHKKLLLRVSSICERGVIFLNTEKNTFQNPFSFELRAKWINFFLKNEKIINITLTIRNTNLEPKHKYIEYKHAFNDEKFTILTTNETDSLFKSLDFETINHHDPKFANKIWYQGVKPNSLHGYGEIIRSMLRQNQNCSKYIDTEVETQAKEYLAKM